MSTLRSGLLVAGALLASCAVDTVPEPIALGSVLLRGDTGQRVDVGDGDVAGLIAQIEFANASGTPTLIRLARNGSYSLVAQAGNSAFDDCEGPNGLPTVTGTIAIDGRGATIARSGAAFDFRIFHIASTGQLVLHDLSLRNGLLSTAGFGGGVCNTGRLTLSRSLILESRASVGGGLTNAGGIALLRGSTIAGNQADFGGGVLNLLGTLTLDRSTLSQNTADNAGGLLNAGGTTAVSNSTVSANSALAAFGECGGLCNELTPGRLLVASSTITDNHANSIGGGIQNIGKLLIVRNSIVAANTSNGGGPDCAGTIGSEGFNLIGLDADAVCNFMTLGATDLVGGIAPIDPRLDALSNNGGPTQTHALRAASPAIDRANPLGCLAPDGTPLFSDQRLRPRTVDGNADATAICDIGAFELRPGDIDGDTDEGVEEDSRQEEGDQNRRSDED